MKKHFTILLLLACGICKGQNLFLNSSFENYTTCPTNVCQVDSVVNWFQLSQSPDYFNSCSTDSNITVPKNLLGYQPAHSGNAYCGMFSYAGSIQNYREYIGTQISNSLIINQKYFLSFYLSLSGGIIQKKGCNKFGCKLSTIPFLNNIMPDNNALIYSDSIITDTINWVLIKFSFIADSAYKYIAFGNFFDDSLTDTIWLDSLAFESYYYIDDVCLSNDSLTCNPSTEEGINDLKNEKELILFPNPFKDKINITAKRNETVEVTMYDVTTRKLLQQTFTSSTTLNTEQLAKGIYIYEVRNKIGPVQSGKIVKE